jgi:hypothetical protein
VPPLPFLAAKPSLGEAVAWTWTAFWKLSRDRAFGFGEGPIPEIAVRDFAAWHGMGPGDAYERFEALIFDMDTAYLDHRAEQREADRRQAELDARRGIR